MANSTDKFATSVHGTNPQNLIEYIMRQKIYDSLYWKQYCFGLSAEDLVDKAVELRFIGGMFGEPQKPTEFICLVLKLLQIQPDKDIVLEYIRNDEFKYLRVLGAFYMRLVGRSQEVYQYLEPLLNDYRRIRLRKPDGSFELTFIDDIIDQMLTRDYLFNIALPRLQERGVLETTGQLAGPRVSQMQDEFDAKIEIFKKEARESLADSGLIMYEFSESKRKREKWRLQSNKNGSSSRDTPSTRKRDRNSYRDDAKEEGEVYGDHRADAGARSGTEASMSVEETNALRASLGLAPLKN
jgi:pre-mRNA-splicing factor 38A